MSQIKTSPIEEPHLVAEVEMPTACQRALQSMGLLLHSFLLQGLSPLLQTKTHDGTGLIGIKYREQGPAPDCVAEAPPPKKEPEPVKEEPKPEAGTRFLKPVPRGGLYQKSVTPMRVSKYQGC